MNDNYLAGFFDGEGCIHGQQNESVLRITITQKRRGTVIREIQRYLGYGNVRLTKTGTYQFMISRREDCKNFLTRILPLSIVKKREIEVAIQLLNLGGRQGKTRAEINLYDRLAQPLFNLLSSLKKASD